MQMVLNLDNSIVGSEYGNGRQTPMTSAHQPSVKFTYPNIALFKITLH